MDFKGIAIYVSALIVGNINELLTTGGLVLNIAYIGYQLYSHHKKNNE